MPFLISLKTNLFCYNGLLMTMDKICNLKDIQDGQQVKGIFLVKEMAAAETKAGKPYLMLTLMDATGEIAARVWENAEKFMPACPAGAVVAVAGLAQAYKGVNQLRLDSLSRVNEAEVDFSLLVPSTSGDLNLMTKELLKLAGSVENPFLRELLLAFFSSKEFLTAFKKAPAAKSMHHAYLGGLLEHSLGVARLATETAKLYPSLDQDLLIAGALLHDLGKVKEFEFSSFPFDYSDQGRLVGHMVLGIEMIQEKIARIKGFPEELATRIKHLILSHHGRYEFGSPSLPMVREAFALNFLDDLDAKMNYLDKLAERVGGEGYQWTDYQRNLERFLFVRGHSASDQAQSASAEEETAIDPRQRNLFGV
jgi:3'-5' exoribonuclease